MNDMGMLPEPPMPPADPSMMGGDPNMMGQDPNAMPPADTGAEQPPMDGEEEPQGNDSGVDKGAEQDAGNLSNTLADANAETAKYVGNMIASALGNNTELKSSDRKKMAEKIIGTNTENDEEMPQDGGQEPPMQESRRRINKLIDEALNDILYNSDTEDRPNKKLPKSYKRRNPFLPRTI